MMAEKKGTAGILPLLKGGFGSLMGITSSLSQGWKKNILSTTRGHSSIFTPGPIFPVNLCKVPSKRLTQHVGFYLVGD